MEAPSSHPSSRSKAIPGWNSPWAPRPPGMPWNALPEEPGAISGARQPWSPLGWSATTRPQEKPAPSLIEYPLRT